MTTILAGDPATRPISLPADWHLARLGDVCRIVGGSTPASGVGGYWDGEIVWITPTDLRQLGAPLIATSDRKITPIGYGSCGTTLVPVGSVILSCRAPIGLLGIAGVPLCTNQGCKALAPHPGLDSDWLYYALLASVQSLEALGSGTTFRELSRSKLAAFEIALPPLSEQKRIVAALTEQLDAVEHARRAVAAQIEAAHALPAAYLRVLFASEEAKQWPRRRLGALLELRKEVVHPRDNPSGPAAFVGLEHVENGTGRRLGQLTVEMSELTGRKPRFFARDVVYGYLRPYLNKVWVAEFDGLCSVDQYVYSANGAILPEFAAAFMRSPAFLTRAPIHAAPGQLPRIRTKEVASVELEVPPLAEQQAQLAKLAAQISSTEQATDALLKQAQTLEDLRAALLASALSGSL